MPLAATVVAAPVAAKGPVHNSLNVPLQTSTLPARSRSRVKGGFGVSRGASDSSALCWVCAEMLGEGGFGIGSVFILLEDALLK
jgi:hypothetical protein